jgi:lambda family phage tail tape measure protein
MADQTYTVGIETRQATTALAGLRSQILGVGAALAGAFTIRELIDVTSRFENLRTSLGLVFKDVEAGAAAFDQIKAFAASSVFSVEQLTETVIKLKAAGLDPTVKQLQLFADISSVAADSVGALAAVTDLFARTTAGGLGLEDLNRLQDRGIPVFKILAEEAGLARDEISKVGQSAEGAQAILAVLQDGLSKQFSGASAAKATTLSQAISNLQDALDNMFDSIGQSGFNEALRDAINSLTDFITKNKELIQTIGAGLGEAIRFAADNAKILAGVMAGIFAASVANTIITIVQSVIAFSKAMKAAAISGAILQGVIGVGIPKLLAGLAATGAAVATINALSDDATEAMKSVNDERDRLNSGPITAGTGVDAAALEQSKTLITQLKTGQDGLNASANKYFDQYRNGVADFEKNISQQNELLKLTDAQAEVQRGLNTFEQQYLNTIRPLHEKIVELKAKGTDASRAEAEQIQAQITAITSLYNESTQGVREQLQLQQSVTSEMERQRVLAETLRDIGNDQVDFAKSMDEAVRQSQYALDDLNLFGFDAQLNDIKRTMGSDLVAAQERLNTAVANNEITSGEAAKQYEIFEKTAVSAYEQIIANAEAVYEQQRSFTYGWKKAFESYKDEATNAAKAAERIFDRVTSGMEDAIVGFAKTGKFAFKEFAASVLEDMLRIQARQLITSSLSTIGGMMGGSQGKGLFGGFFATGGFIPEGRFGVVGEAGAEVVEGPANVTPLSKLGQSVTYNINAVDARSFRDLVARDPGFIHAIAMRGGAAIPSGR